MPAASTKDTTTATGNAVLILPLSFATCSSYPMPTSSFFTKPAHHHTDGLTEANVTIQVCWDADRLDLGRVGIIPAPNKLCTPAAKKPKMLKWADGRAGFEVVPEIVKDEWGIDLARN